MKKFPILQTILVILLIGVIALGFSMTKKKANTPEISKTQIEETGSDIVASGTTSLYDAEQKQLQEKMDAYAIYNSAVDALDITLCEKIVGNDKLKMECNDNVYAAQASKEKNGALCEKIQDTTVKAHCANKFIYDTALISLKQSDCDKIDMDSDLKNACAKNIVFAQIETSSFSGSTDVCTSLVGADKDYCINRIKKASDIDLLQKATNTKDIALCGQIKDMSMKNTCSDTVYMTLALEKQDGSLCNRIIDVGRKTNCITQFARINDANLLSKALAENNLPLCTTITSADLKMKCTDTLLLKQGVTTKDALICTKIGDIGIRKQCSDAVKLILDQINKQK